MKELKLEQLQSKFVGSIVKKSSKYYVTYPNSTREYGYKCNLKQLAEKLNIEVEEFLGDDTVYQTKNKSSFNRYITTLNNAEKERDILSQESFLSLLPENIKKVYELSQEGERSNSFNKVERKVFVLFAKVNRRKETIELIIDINEQLKIPSTSYISYYRICTFSNQYINTEMVKFDIDQFIKNKVNEFKNSKMFYE